ncbi:MAG: membrane protein insertion efficiency factor YidD [Deltaproteobacteria bacterium]|nr:membrane protein insertion efficiency factor YidD [Deltaproteobacteria bacterium]MCL5791957.1 membrane protein insertion efficiency factor YidD [Deltaproteobacteria bacterium]
MNYRNYLQKLNKLTSLLFIKLIKVYRITISPWTGASCRFNPTCSVYSIEAIEKYGIAKGGFMSIKRILKCHPFHPGGNDPVV